MGVRLNQAQLRVFQAHASLEDFRSDTAVAARARTHRSRAVQDANPCDDATQTALSSEGFFLNDTHGRQPRRS